MAKIFNVTGDCKPNKHYMVKLDTRLAAIKAMVDEGLILPSIVPDSMERPQRFGH